MAARCSIICPAAKSQLCRHTLSVLQRSNCHAARAQRHRCALPQWRTQPALRHRSRVAHHRVQSQCEWWHHSLINLICMLREFPCVFMCFKVRVYTKYVDWNLFWPFSILSIFTLDMMQIQPYKIRKKYTIFISIKIFVWVRLHCDGSSYFQYFQKLN